MNWFISLFNKSKGFPDQLKVGSRVQTSVGRGVVTHGSVTIKYDAGTKTGYRNQHPNNTTMSHNLDKITLL